MIISDHGLYTGFNLPHILTFIITLPPANEIMEAQSGQKVQGYTLENTELEYETIDNSQVGADITKRYMVGRSLSFEHVTMLKSVECDKDATMVNKPLIFQE